MGDYLRTTRECKLDELEPKWVTAVLHHAETYQLGDITQAAPLCCETRSTKKKKGLFGGKPEVIVTGIVVTTQWLIWAAGKEGDAPAVASARLRDIQVQDYEKSAMYKLVQDSGLNIFGLHTDSPDPGSTFIGLGPEPAAQKLRNLLKEAVEQA